jgi:hypothetical protein
MQVAHLQDQQILTRREHHDEGNDSDRNSHTRNLIRFLAVGC